MTGHTGGILTAFADAEQKNSDEEKPSAGMTVLLTKKERETLKKLTLLGIAPLPWAEAEEPAPLDDLRRVFVSLVEITDQNNVDVVQAKAAIAAALCRFVEKEQEIPEVEKKKHPPIMWWVFGVLSTFWVARDSISVVMGIRDILPMSLLSPLPFAIISIIAVTITCVLLCFMELQFFRMAMEVESIDPDIAKLEADRHKMESVTKINNVLMKNSGSDLSMLVRFAALLNEDAEKERIKYSKPYPETSFQSWSWFAVRLFGVTVGLFSDFFTYHSILVFIAPALVGTPVGIAILGFSMLVSLCIYGVMYRKSFIRSLVPHFNEYEENQKTAKNFSTYSKEQLTNRCNTNKVCKQVNDALTKNSGLRRTASESNIQVTLTLSRLNFFPPVTGKQLKHQAEAGQGHQSSPAVCH